MLVKGGSMSSKVKSGAKIFLSGNSFWVVSPNGDKVKCHNRATARFLASNIDKKLQSVK
tara:strand:+ start:1220 stop:1396 length:177 start_codon:yes stop_codon:yes gene_type:complete